VHWHESNVHPNEESSEMNLSKEIIVLQTNDFFDSEVSCREDGKDCTHRQYVMEVCYYVVSVMKCNVDPSVSQNYTRQPTNRE